MSELKTKIKELNEDEFEIDNIVASKNVQTRVSLNEERLLDILDSVKNRDIGLIKTKPYG